MQTIVLSLLGFFYSFHQLQLETEIANTPELIILNSKRPPRAQSLVHPKQETNEIRPGLTSVGVHGDFTPWTKAIWTGHIRPLLF